MKIFFRFNAGFDWGLGHLYRNIALMKELQKRGYCCEALINNFSVAIDQLDSYSFSWKIVDEYETADDILNLIKDEELLPNQVVLFFDKMFLETEYIDTLIREGIYVVCYDVDQESTLRATLSINSRYSEVFHKKLLYGGPLYQVLREDVELYSTQIKTIHEKCNSVFVHFGGTDPMGIVKKTYEAVKDINNINFLFVSGAASYREDLDLLINSKENMQYKKELPDFARVMYESDVAIISGGVTAYEASAIGVPVLMLAQNDDQKITQEIFAKNTGSIDLGLANEFDFSKLSDYLNDLLVDHTRRKLISEKQKAFVYPGGIKRICSAIESLFK